MSTTKRKTVKKQKLTGEKLLKAAVNQIINNPESWHQESWHCGTKHCLFGWCQILAGKKPDDYDIYDEVKGLLNLADYLSGADRTLPEIYYFAQEYKNLVIPQHKLGKVKQKDIVLKQKDIVPFQI